MYFYNRSAVFSTIALFFLVGGCSTSRPPRDVITVTGEVWQRGNAPFTALVLTTDQANDYVLVVDESRTRIQAPARVRVTGRVYAADWNGIRFAHLEVMEIERIE